MSFNQNYKADKNVPDMSFMMEVSVWPREENSL